MESELFINFSYGWLCKSCHAKEDEAGTSKGTKLARFFREGEAESKEPQLSTESLARWRDAGRRTLFCPRCGAEETITQT